MGTVCALLALAATLAGCGSDSGDDAGAPAPAAPSRTAERSPASPTPTKASSSPSPSPTAVKPMKPSTPAELRACADGSCTVVVTKGTELPRAAGLGAGPFTVSAVAAGGVDLTSVDASGFTSNLLGQRPDQGGPSTVNELSIAVLAIAEDTAKLRLFPAEH
ncbi:hypothetical protein ACM01_20445 [Streptomyces viridochromogenes]|uniref:Lipoprotein n=1 Tax=Streptomyces viridochromogenes TaxID=1938 RepID=A0A0J7ZBE5_STRVR|nr:hypothetical protein ACM01_20445 [Streptomyces viridochromogenes]KOG11890.1 hypothetical protein ADK36_36225 [Streptomyces viridochromogenes]KOG24079.1 hypothetical protein ADK35_11905 [Streptomyces viridochromogenes]